MEVIARGLCIRDPLPRLATPWRPFLVRRISEFVIRHGALGGGGGGTTGLRERGNDTSKSTGRSG